MELNKTKYNFTKHLLHELKTKKSWISISTIILLVTNILVPTVLKYGITGINERYGEAFVIFGIIETFVLVFLSCMIDFSFLHSDSRLSYYLSKPISLKNQIFVKISSNMILILILIFLSFVSVAYHKLTKESLEMFKFIVPWLVVGVLTAALSSVLSGNTIVAGALTVFNFAIPAIFYLLLTFMFSILENAVIGFDSNILMNLVTIKYYDLEFIYLFDYVNKPIDIKYALLIIGTFTILAILLIRSISKRKNENVGDFIVSNSYKYFATFILSLIFPALFSISVSDTTLVSKIIVSLILAGLSYYVIIAIVEKSFKISFYPIKVFLVNMVVFMLITGGTVFLAHQNKDIVPQASEVKIAYVGYNSRVISYVDDEIVNKDIDTISYGDLKSKYNINLLKQKENIESITKLHKELLQDQTYKRGGRVVISYWLNDGSYLIRRYKLKSHNDINAEKVVERKDLIAKEIINTEELKLSNYYFLYDEEYIKDRDIYVRINNDWKGKENSSEEKLIAISEIKEYLKKDIDKIYQEPIQDNIALDLLMYGNEVAQKYAEPTTIETTAPQHYIEVFEKLDKSKNNVNVLSSIYVDKRYENTLEFINNKINNQN